jgi:hypothetical protein
VCISTYLQMDRLFVGELLTTQYLPRFVFYLLRFVLFVLCFMRCFFYGYLFLFVLYVLV